MAEANRPLNGLSFEIARLHASYASCISPLDVIDEVQARIAAAADPGIFLHLTEPEQLRRQALELGSFDPAALPLWGIPFAVKDNIDCAGAPTTAACPAFAYRAEADATAVARLRAAGALMVGKTNLDQLATGLVGVRTPYAVPRNPIDPSRIPGGSSSGSAVATACGIVSFALGTDTAGSGRIPAGLNNIVGLKPSLGSISTKGVVPACRTLDCVSIFALTTNDAWRVLCAAAGFDGADPFSRPLPAPRLQSPPVPVRVAVPDSASRHFFGDPNAEAGFDSALDMLSDLGADLVPIDFSPFFDVASLLYEGAWLAERLAAIEEFAAKSADALHPVTAEIIDGAGKLTAVDAFRGIYRLKELERKCETIFKPLDIMAVPTVPRFYTLDEVVAEPILTNSRLGTYTNFVNLLDLCALAVPTQSRPDGLPGSITLIARSGQDGLLATMADRLHANAGVSLGATDWEATERLPAHLPPSGVLLAVVGAHMRDLPLNWQLKDRRAEFVEATRTAPRYRLYDLADATPRKPGMIRVERGGASIELELWRLETAAFGDFVAQVPAPMTIGDVTLEDGTVAKGFLVEAAAIEHAPDITHHGGWRAFLGAVDKAAPR